MFAALLSKFIIENNILETSLIVMYNDNDNFKIICDPGGVFIIDFMLIYGIETGDSVIINYNKENVILSIQKANKHTFCGFIHEITEPDADLHPDYYYELHPKPNVRGQINIPEGARLVMPKSKRKIILPNKPIMLEYVKGPCKNYYEVI